MFDKKIDGRAALILFMMFALALSAVGAVPAVTEKAKIDFSGLDQEHFRFNLQSANDYLEYNAFRDPAKMNPKERFRYDYYMRDWKALKKTFSAMDDYTAGNVYSRILNELTNGSKPALTLDDYIGILNVCPVEPSKKWLKQLGVVARAVVLPEEKAQLAARLRKGVGFYGGSDSASKIRAGQVMMHASFNKIASEFLPSVADAGEIDDEDVREEIVHFRTVVDKSHTESVQRVVKRWDEYAQALLLQAPEKNGKAFHELTQMIGHDLPYDKVCDLIKDINTKSGELAGGFAMLASKKIASDQRNASDEEMRLRNLELAAKMMDSLSEWTDIGERPWSIIANTLADVWLQEAARTIKELPEYEHRIGNGRWKNFIEADDLLSVIPQGVWLESISKDMAKRIGYYLPKVTMFSSDSERTVELIVKLSENDPAAATVIAEEYLNRWADLHDPVIPDYILRRYKMPSGSVIIVTPIMTDKNVTELARIMAMLRERKVKLQNNEKILRAFQMCYGSSEIYRRDHIEKVFGPLDEMDAGLFSVLIHEMADGLGSRWRKAALKKSDRNPTGRNNPVVVVRKAYADAVDMVDSWSAKHPAGWKPLTLAGSILNDWADFEFFQQMASTPALERMQLYKEKSALSQSYFMRGAEAYVKAVKGISSSSYSADAYFEWFNSMLGINISGEINLSKKMNRPALEQIRGMIYALPQDCRDTHIKLFAQAVKQVSEDMQNPLPSELKYRYVSSALIITRATPFGAAFEKKEKYFDQLLNEARLVTEIDGPSTVCRKSEFGLVISLVHSVTLGDQINFAKYITPQADYANSEHLKKMKVNADARNEFEDNILQSFLPFFDVKSVTFSNKDVQPHDIGKVGWQATTLAYIQLKPKGISVDRIPSLELNLDFFDESGPVSLPVTSPETMIEVTDEICPPRPFHDVKVTQTLDTRKLYLDGILNLKITAEGIGMMPEIDDLLKFEPLTAKLEVVRTASPAGTVAEQLYSWGEDVQVESVREWNVILNSKPITDAGDKPYLFSYPTAVSTNVAVENLVFNDADLITVDGSEVVLSKASETGAASVGGIFSSGKGRLGFFAAVAVAAAVVIVLIIVTAVIVRKRRADKPLRARDVFCMPDKIDSFTLVRLLRNLAVSPLVADNLRSDLNAEITKIEESAFCSDGSEMNEEELRVIAKKWLKRI